MSLSLIRRTACDVTYTMIMETWREREREKGEGEKRWERREGRRERERKGRIKAVLYEASLLHLSYSDLQIINYYSMDSMCGLEAPYNTRLCLMLHGPLDPITLCALLLIQHAL